MFDENDMKAKDNLFSEMSNEEQSEESNECIRPFFRTFGYFDVFIDGRPLRFYTVKEKELIAILIDHEGGFASDREIMDCLYEGQPQDNTLRTQYRRVVKQLKETLENYGISHIMLRNNKSMCILKDMVECDLFGYKDGDSKYIDQYDGFYMRNYSWAETTHAALEYRQTFLMKR